MNSLLRAARSGRNGVLSLLACGGTRIDRSGEDGWMALIKAARSNNTGTVTQLLDKGAKKDLPDKDGCTALMWAAREGHAAVVTLLLDKGASKDLADKDGYTALMWAALQDRATIVTLLLDKEASVDNIDKDGCTALLWATLHDRAAMVTLLLDGGASIDNASKDGYSALMWATLHDRANMVTLLLDRGASIDSADKDGCTALMWATRNDNASMVTLLLDKGAAINIADKDGYTALMWASQYNHGTMVTLLLDKGAKVNISDKDGYSALIWATLHDRATMVALLLDRGACIDNADKDGNTALMWAAVNGHATMVVLLLDRGACIDCADKDGSTALMIAARDGHPAVVTLLLNRGASIDRVDKMGRTVFDCTKSVLVLQLLRKASAIKVAIQAKADQAAANQAAALKAADEQARFIQVKADKAKANQDRADQVAADQAAATATAARNAQLTSHVLDGFSDGGPVSLPSLLISQWTSGFKNKIYSGYFSSIYSGLILPSEGSGEGQRVAVKKLNKAVALQDDAKAFQLSTREQDEATSFHHANIIRLVGYYLPPSGNLSESEQSMKEPCLVYEYAPCGGLNTILKDNDKAAKLNWHSRLNIAIGVSKGLHYMHSSIADCPAYHRDIKSSHIALMADYTPRIIDYRPHTMYCPWGWGDSTVSDHFDTCDRPGTFEYMCPDYRSGEVIKYDATCEVYSFGIVLLELLTGQLQGCMDENGYKVILEAVYLDTQVPKVDDRVQWPADLVDDFLALARQCIAPYQRRIRSMTTVLHRLEAMSNKHYTSSTIEIGLIEQNNLLLSRLAALELRADIQAMQAVETTYKCMSCLDDDIPASKGSVCSNRTFPHFYCGVERNNCLGNMLLSQSNDITHFKRNSCQILCACCVALSPRVVSTFDVSVIARQSNRETLDTYIRTITDAERQQGALATEKLRSEHVIEIQMLNEAYSTGKASRLKGMTERHRFHIINNIMTLLCPHCKMAIFDFVNCFAVKHESDDSHLEYGCGLYFCGWCLAKCESSGDCHSHVRKCRHSMNPGNAYGNFPVDFDAAHAKRRKELILRYLQVGISDPQDRKKVHLALQKELNELGVNIGNPDSSVGQG